MDEAQGIQVLRSRCLDTLNVAFTGTRHGMTIGQMICFERIINALWKYRVGEWHDGDCVGADTQAHEMVEHFNHIRRGHDEDHIIMHGHPCNLKKFRAHNEYHQMHPVESPLVRNRHMVCAADVLIATPMEYEEQHRGSGTWATVRFAERMNVPTFMLFPDETVEVRHVREG